MQAQQQFQQFIQQVYSMDNEVAETIVKHFEYKEIPKNTFLLKEGKPCNEYYFLVNGFARAFIYDVDGNDVTTMFYTPNNMMCELSSFFKRIPSAENIQTLTDCSLLVINFNELQTVFHSIQQFREFGRLVLVNAYSNLKQRMLNNLQCSAEQRYKQLIETNSEIFQHAQLKQIATYLGITDTSLSRIRKEFAQH
jgi:CRP-like cAMP-binding protein